MAMTQRLVDKARIPYGSYYKLDLPDLGMVGTGRTFDMLLDSIRAYRKANAIPVGLGFEEEVEQVVCRTHPKECKGAYPDAVPKPVRIGFRDVINGTTLMTKQMISNTPLVNQEEADRRAAICSKCPWLSDVQMPCVTICAELQAIVQAVIGAKSTTSQGLIEKKCCGVCHCFTSSSVWVDLDLQLSVLSDQQKAQFREVQSHYPCWKKRDDSGNTLDLRTSSV